MSALHVLRRLRPTDPQVYFCETCNGVIVADPRLPTVCPSCGAKPCPGCARIAEAAQELEAEPPKAWSIS